MKSMTIKIGTDGTAQVEVNGVAGPACEKLTEEIEKALGTVTDRKRTADYHKRGVDHGQHTGR